jgi:hypothetical protein
MRAVSFLLILLHFNGNSSHAKTIHIPSDYYTIQQGIDSSTNGDTVLVSPGTYYENINFNGKNIVLGSLFITTGDTSYISQTVIDGNEQGTVVIFENGEDSTAVLSGFTITNGFFKKSDTKPKGGAGVECRLQSHATLKYLKVISNKISDDYSRGGTIACYDSSCIIIQNVLVRDNFGSGLMCMDSSSVTMDESVIQKNTARTGGGVFCVDSYLEMNDVIVEANNTYSNGGGLYLNGSLCFFRFIRKMDTYY